MSAFWPFISNASSLSLASKDVITPQRRRSLYRTRTFSHGKRSHGTDRDVEVGFLKIRARTLALVQVISTTGYILSKIILLQVAGRR